MRLHTKAIFGMPAIMLLRIRVYANSRRIRMTVMLLGLITLVKIRRMNQCRPEEEVLRFQQVGLKPFSRDELCKTSTAYKKLKFGDMELMKPLNEPRPDFEYVLQPIEAKYKEEHNPDDVVRSVVVMVKTHWRNIDRRTVIRETWASCKLYRGTRLFVFFVIGHPTNMMQQNLLEREHEDYGDILQINRTETYEDVGLKTIGGMQWVANTFPGHWIYASSDDDVVPDLKHLYRTIKAHWYRGLNDTSTSAALSSPILCNFALHTDPKPLRAGGDIKNIVPRDVYPADIYPTFCSGGFYTMSVEVCNILYRLSRFHSYFLNDDVWITGLLRLIAVDAGYLPCLDVSREDCGISTYRIVTVKHYMGNMKFMRRRWRAVQRSLDTP